MIYDNPPSDNGVMDEEEFSQITEVAIDAIFEVFNPTPALGNIPYDPEEYADQCDS